MLRFLCSVCVLCVNVRKYKHGDEKFIAQVMVRSFSTFKEWGLTPEKWLDYEKIDPGFSRERAFVAQEEDGRILSHVQLVSRYMKIGNLVRVAGVANVCTDPDSRQRGIATEVLKEALRDAAKWSSLSGLDTTYAGAPHRLYRKLGFSPFHFFRRFTGERWDVERAIKRLKKVAGPILSDVRHFQSSDKMAMKSIYDENLGVTNGMVKRDDHYWEGKLFSRNSWQTFFYRDFKEEEVLVLPERAYAYFDWDEKTARLTVREALAIPKDLSALAAVYAAALSVKPEANEFVVVAPEGDSGIESLMADLYPFRVQNSFMFSILKPYELFQEIRAFTSPYDIKVKFQIYNDVGFLEPVTVSLYDLLPAKAQAEPDATLYVHQTTLLRMMSGLEDPVDAFTNDKLVIQGHSQGVVKALSHLFPRHPFILWPSDRW